MYSRKTSVFGIPVIGPRQPMELAEELRKYTIIENLLLASSKGVRCCVFQEGFYSVHKNNENTFTVSLVAIGSATALTGIVNGGFVNAKDSILWPNLKVGTQYHLYVVYQPGLYEDASHFSVVASEEILHDKNGLYLYLATSDGSSVNTYPDGKVYSFDVALHGNDNINPHGTEVIQDVLNINEKMVISENADIIAKGLTTVDKSLITAVNDAISQQNHLVEFVDFKTTSTTGTTLSVSDDKKILAVNVHQIVVEDKMMEVGEIGVMYVSPNTITIYNSGASDVSMRAVIYYTRV